jgi:hypothetical protein
VRRWTPRAEAGAGGGLVSGIHEERKGREVKKQAKKAASLKV